MANKSIVSTFVMVLISFSLIFSIPIVFLSNTLSTYDIINESLHFEFTPDTPFSIEKIFLNVDVGIIEIRYIDPPVDYHVKIDVNIEMSGANLAGRNHSHYFDIDWQTSGSSANFTMKLLSDDWFDLSMWSMKNVSIVVTLRKDIVFDIIAKVNKGDLELTVPWGVSINDLVLNVTEGDIIYDFDHCGIEGNITCINSRGDIRLNATNVKYTRNSVWTLITELGNIEIDIVQYIDLGANVTGKILISTKGDLHFFYKDNKPSVGAIFILLRKMLTGGIPTVDLFGDNTIGLGFERSFLPEGRGNVYTSSDFPATNCYNFGMEEKFAITGGIAKNIGVVKRIEE